MKCYFHYDEKTKERVLIPECWPVVNSYDIEDCTCQPDYVGFERKRYNEAIKAKNQEIKYLQKEIERLNKRVEYWHKKAK